MLPSERLAKARQESAVRGQWLNLLQVAKYWGQPLSEVLDWTLEELQWATDQMIKQIKDSQPKKTGRGRRRR